MRAPPTPAPRKSNAMLNHRPARKEVYNKPPKSKHKPPKAIGIGLLVAGVNCLTGETGDGTWGELSPDNIW